MGKVYGYQDLGTMEKLQRSKECEEACKGYNNPVIQIKWLDIMYHAYRTAFTLMDLDDTIPESVKSKMTEYFMAEKERLMIHEGWTNELANQYLEAIHKPSGGTR